MGSRYKKVGSDNFTIIFLHIKSEESPTQHQITQPWRQFIELL